MQNKRDQLHAHQFLVGRMVAALVRGEPDLQESPLRRAGSGTVIGVVVALLLSVGFGLYGLVAPGGSTAWQQPGTIIVEQETGTRYLYLDGTLRPTLNYASAKLAVTGAGRPMTSVSRNSLAGTQHGRPVGIPGAPDAIPTPANLSADPWLVCATEEEQPNGSTKPGTLLTVAGGPASTPVPHDNAVLVRSTDGANYLVWRDERLRVTDRAALVALGFSSAQPLVVDPSWLNSLRAGPDLVATMPEGTGSPGLAVGGQQTRVGQVFEVRLTGDRKDFYLMRADGLAGISQTEAALLLARAETAAAYPGAAARPLPMTAGQLDKAQWSAAKATEGRLPAIPPSSMDDQLTGGRTLCLAMTFTERGQHGRLVTVDREAVATAGVRAGGDGRTADRVLVPPGGGALVSAQSGPGTATGSTYLITDLGVLFPLPSNEVVNELGYSGVAPLPVPTTVLAFLPTGPVLDPVAARKEWGPR
ncbi:type VII secretion protein EccB [Allokutzneria oryzae]|uniref:Type VII secretion protein EccB n=1 Tax=Allokutzneria oryzae TaxID=1378989 RepID=A0ABV6A7A2_9PSEU